MQPLEHIAESFADVVFAPHRILDEMLKIAQMVENVRIHRAAPGGPVVACHETAIGLPVDLRERKMAEDHVGIVEKLCQVIDKQDQLGRFQLGNRLSLHVEEGKRNTRRPLMQRVHPLADIA